MSTLSSTTGRAAAILTNAEVKSTTLDMQTTADGRVTVDLSFTIGSLTNMIVKFYGSADNVTFDQLALADGTLCGETLTASAERMYVIDAPVRYFAVGITGTGTLTSSSCAIVYRYQTPLVSSQTDGVLRLS